MIGIPVSISLGSARYLQAASRADGWCGDGSSCTHLRLFGSDIRHQVSETTISARVPVHRRQHRISSRSAEGRDASAVVALDTSARTAQNESRRSRCPRRKCWSRERTSLQVGRQRHWTSSFWRLNSCPRNVRHPPESQMSQFRGRNMSLAA